MITAAEQVQERIKTKGIKAVDIKHHGRLSDEQIKSIPLSLVYMWIRTGEWNAKDFRTWLSVKEIYE